MSARIYKPAKTAMQSGQGNTKDWALDFEPETARTVEPLMGWTSSGDMRQQVRLRFIASKRPPPIASGMASPIRCASAKRRARHVMSYSRQFRFQAPRRLDALTGLGPAWRPVSGADRGFWHKLATPAGFEPATPSLEG